MGRPRAAVSAKRSAWRDRESASAVSGRRASASAKDRVSCPPAPRRPQYQSRSLMRRGDPHPKVDGSAAQLDTAAQASLVSHRPTSKAAEKAVPLRILITGNMGYVGPVVAAHLRATLPDAEL